MAIKKVTMLCNSLGGGGAEAVMATLCEQFSNKNIDIDFIVTSAQGVYLEKVKRFAQLKEIKTKSRYLIPKLYWHLKKTNPDIVFSTQSHINIPAIIAARFAGVKVVAREATTPSIAYASENWLVGLSLRLAYNWADRIISVSSGVKNDLVNNFKIKNELVHTIYNPIISNELFNKSNEPVDHKWFNLNEPIITSMGRFAKAKDYPTLIKAFNIIRNKIACKLIILGDPDYDQGVKNEVKDLINLFKLNDSIDFAGFQKNPFPYLKKSSLHILSSVYEGLPGSLIQAAALGCNIVSTDCESGPVEILKGVPYSSIVVTGDYKNLALEGIKHLSNNKSENIPSQEFLSKFSLSGICEQYLKLFESLF